MNVWRGKESRRRMVSESGPLYHLLGYDTADSPVDLHRLADPKNQRAGILHAPLHIRNRKVNGCTPSVRPHLCFGRKREFVIPSVNAENSVNLH